MNGLGGGLPGGWVDPSLYQNAHPLIGQAQGINPLAGAGGQMAPHNHLAGQAHQYAPYPTPTPPAPGAAFRIEKIENGFLVHLAPSQLVAPEVHYAADFKEVGELVTASLVRWFIDGK